MTREQAREAAKEAAEVMLGFADGKEVQYSPKQGRGSAVWTSTDNPLWNLEHYDFRLKPTATLRPWTADDVPLGAWLRWKNDNSSRSILSTTGDEKFRESMLKQYEHSTDGGLTWKPCGVEEVKP